jgi:hypothetical protein
MADGPTALELVIQGTQTAAIIVAAGAATWGLNTWRAQMAGKRKFELAEDALTAFYEFEGVIKFVRSPWTKSNEGKDRPEREGESEGVARIRDSYFAPIDLLQKSVREIQFPQPIENKQFLIYRVLFLFNGLAFSTSCLPTFATGLVR